VDSDDEISSSGSGTFEDDFRSLAPNLRSGAKSPEAKKSALQFVVNEVASRGGVCVV